MKKIVEETLKNFDERDGKEDEESLFWLLHFAIVDENFNEVSYLRMYDSLERYARLKSLLENSKAKNNIYI